MFSNNAIWLAQNENPVYLLPSMANRHGLIAGATGTGKTVTLKVLAEAFSDMGVPVFLADIKGDLASLATKGAASPIINERLEMLGIQGFEYKSFPVRFWDIFGENGHPVRTTISEMGPLLLSRLLCLNDTQTGILNIVFRIADEQGLLLLDLKDLREIIRYVGENAKDLTLKYGNISPQSIGAIMRSLIALEDQGGEGFFGEPALDITDWMQTTPEGRGYINILHSVRLFNSPLLYSTFLLWMLSELFETLPETGDLEKPRIVFFFDEAHLLFEDIPKVLLQKIEQVVRLIRSKGVGVYFITQNPADLPQDVLGQLGNRIQHALRAYTPSEQKKVKAAADAFRPNPKFSTEEVISSLATGEALVSCLDSEGRPSIVERAYILPPQSLLGTLDDLTRIGIINKSSMGAKYDTVIDRESAYEILREKALQDQEKIKKEQEIAQKEKESRKAAGRPKTSLVEKATNSAVTAIGRELGRTILRGILGSFRK
ncbi:MAG: helicase HerA-like domain-containing protein [Acetivibrionales bacterium]|jgi:DNA helicase HerA-like ATPase